VADNGDQSLRAEPSCSLEKGHNKIIGFLFPYLKYAFHAAILFFYFLIIQRFFLVNGEDLATAENVIRIALSLPLVFMSMWSHFVASGKDGLEPGYVTWEHFRDEQ